MRLHSLSLFVIFHNASNGSRKNNIKADDFLNHISLHKFVPVLIMRAGTFLTD